MLQIPRSIKFLIALIFAASICDSLPRDSQNTLRRITESRRIRIDLVENQLWVTRSAAGEPAGAEVELQIKSLDWRIYDFNTVPVSSLD